MTAPAYQAKLLRPSVLEVKIDLSESGAEQWFLIRSDVHHDNAHSNRHMEKKHLDQAKERGAGIIDNGDMFCAMQCKWDPRSDPTQLRPEHSGDAYLNRLVEEFSDYYEPYVDNWLLFGYGNHETAHIKRRDFDLTRALIRSLYERTGKSIPFHGYSGWILFKLMRARQSKMYPMFRHHGYGTGAPVTRGVINTARMAVYLPDASIVISGHDHNEWIVPIARKRIGERKGIPYHDEQVHVKVPGYCVSEDEFNGWHIEKGMHPRTVGAAWLRFYREWEPAPDALTRKSRLALKFEVTRAT